MLDLQENIYKQVKKTYYMSAGFARPHVLGFGDLSIDIFLEVQNKEYRSILYLIHYIAYGRKFLQCHKITLHWVLVSEPGFFKVLAHFPGNLIILPEMKPRNNIAY